MTEAPKTIPPEVLEALKRGDKAGAMKMLLSGGHITSLKDIMPLLEQLQASGALKDVKVKMSSGRASNGARAANAMGAPSTATPHVPPHAAAPAPPMRPDLSPGEVPRTSAKSIALVVVLVIATIAVFFALK